MSIDRRVIKYLNWPLLGFTVALFAVGAVNLYSASAIRLEDGIALAPYFEKQLIWGLVGLGGMIAFMLFDYNKFYTLAWPLFIVTLLLLAAVPLFGTKIYGAKRWLDFGAFNFQPSEVAKISVLILGARLLSRNPEKLGWKEFLFTVFVVMIPAGLVVIQPDLGSALNLLLLLAGIILYRGLKGRVLKVLAIIVPAMLPLGWFFLHDYQKQRILTFLDPTNDPLGAGYHIIQSQIAIGSGRLWGKGFLQGTQSQLRFLPEKHTDFAVAVFGEEWGFVGCIILLALFALFLMSIFSTARDARDRFGSFLAAGVFFYFFWQILINMGMVLGLMPVVGIPLPFMSYGGSTTLVNFCLIGLVQNVSMRRFTFRHRQNRSLQFKGETTYTTKK
ncbi:rod shape-determining protein RodA [Oceanidesulfovibrio marinus]|uniref:Peptidoglycan glycosyltransferase RodA n=1 Tax=Oceanidesulfovibrio marinus TaxID=370038 RepID=A0A6P1ZKV5_9BACT|nr:rod shape-determining protein RodA [Oceanidesulfovibrio marinus]QJT09943.1 rod shape-determining protein RodA [Oceanidesulfovibrio marinus]TVM35940.1 rod shape-determining protein RodA [Oceanidesulfovibrio marinus]